MRRLIPALLFTLSLLACRADPPPPSPEEVALTNTVQQLILPWHQTFAASSAQLTQSLTDFCRTPADVKALQASRDSWRTAMLDWQVLHIINFGPVTDHNQAWRIQFWPDTHNRVGQKVEALLAQDTPITAEYLASANVLVQGLSAIEYLLFDPSKLDINTLQPLRVCEYMQAVAQNVQTVAQGLTEAWSAEGGDFAGTFLSAGPNNLTFPTHKTAVAALVSAMVANLEVVKNKKLGDAFGGRPGSGRINAYHLEFWRSQMSQEAMAAELKANRQLYEVAVYPLLLAAEQKNLALQLDAAFTQTEQAINALPKPMFSQALEPSALPAFQTAFDQLGELLALLKRDVPAALGLQLGFNANDGD